MKVLFLLALLITGCRESASPTCTSPEGHVYDKWTVSGRYQGGTYVEHRCTVCGWVEVKKVTTLR